MNPKATGNAARFVGVFTYEVIFIIQVYSIPFYSFFLEAYCTVPTVAKICHLLQSLFVRRSLALTPSTPAVVIHFLLVSLVGSFFSLIRSDWFLSQCTCGWNTNMDTYVCVKYRWIGDLDRPLPWEPYLAAKTAVLYRPRDCILLEEFILCWAHGLCSPHVVASPLFIYSDSVLRDAVRRFGCPDAVLLLGDWWQWAHCEQLMGQCLWLAFRQSWRYGTVQWRPPIPSPREKGPILAHHLLLLL